MIQTELKKRQTKLDTLIVMLDPRNDPSVVADAIELTKSAAVVVVHSPMVPVGTWPAKINGLNVVQHKNYPPNFHTVIAEYISRVRGNTLFGLVLPKVKLRDTFEDVYRYADENRMERTYGYYALDKNETPCLFVFTGNMAEFMFHAIHHTVPFGNEAWAKATHYWALRGIMKHRYFDATRFGVATVNPEPTVAEPTVNPPEPEPIPDVTQTVTLKEPTVPQPKKRGRPRKTK